MSNTALNRTEVVLLTNKSGGDLTQGAVVIVDNANAASFTTTTTSGSANSVIGVILDPGGIVNNAIGTVAVGGYVPKINLSGSASLGDFFKTHTVAGQAVRHAPPTVVGDFGEVLGTGTTPAAVLFGAPVQTSSGGGTGLVSTLMLTIDGAGSAITSGSKGDMMIDFACTINAATLLADTTGSLVLDIYQGNYAGYPPVSSITASAKPTLAGASKYQDTTLSGWTTSVSAGDILRFNVDSAATVTRCLVALKVTRT